MDTTVGNAVRLRAYCYTNQLGDTKLVVPDSLTLSLYDPSNVLVYQDSKPIPVMGPDNITISSYIFTLPGEKFVISTVPEAPYTAQVKGTRDSSLIANSVPISVA